MGMGGFHRALCIVVCLCVRFATAADCTVKSKQEILTGLPALDKYATEALTRVQITGISLVVFKDGEVLFEKAYGDGVSQPFFQAASISKPVAAFGALKLVEEEALNLDVSLSRFVKKPYLPPQEFAELVTLRTVLNHTSGMNNDVSGIDRTIYFKPGTQTAYSGAAFLYMQQAMQDVSGKAFETYMSGVLRKIGMAKSSFELDYEGEHYVAAPFSLVTTPRELMSFFDGLAHPAPTDVWAAKQLTTPSYPFDAQTDRGLGILIQKCGDEVGVYHTGSNFSIHKSVGVIYPKTRTGAVVMVRGPDAYGYPSEIAHLATGGLVPGF
jgi:CubicO group peptidase (beta-lactamase class C family)